MPGDVYFFDCDNTLYAYDFQKRLPLLAALTGASQYQLAKTWWEGGHEAASEAGAFASTEEYLEAFERVTGVALSREHWFEARAASMAPIDGALEALAWAAEHGTVSLLSNNPVIFRDYFAALAPEAAVLLGENVLVSALLGARKPEPLLYARALAHYGVEARDAFFVDDSAANVRGAAEAGIRSFRLASGEPGSYNTDELLGAMRSFAAR